MLVVRVTLLGVVCFCWFKWKRGFRLHRFTLSYYYKLGLCLSFAVCEPLRPRFAALLVMAALICSRWALLVSFVFVSGIRRVLCVFFKRWNSVIVNISTFKLRVGVLKDGAGVPPLRDRNADVLVSRELVGRGAWPLRGARDPVEEPISFLVFTLEARVRTVLTNHRRRFAHVDVM